MVRIQILHNFWNTAINVISAYVVLAMVED